MGGDDLEWRWVQWTTEGAGKAQDTGPECGEISNCLEDKGLWLRFERWEDHRMQNYNSLLYPSPRKKKQGNTHRPDPS